MDADIPVRRAELGAGPDDESRISKEKYYLEQLLQPGQLLNAIEDRKLLLEQITQELHQIGILRRLFTPTGRRLAKRRAWLKPQIAFGESWLRLAPYRTRAVEQRLQVVTRAHAELRELQQQYLNKTLNDRNFDRAYGRIYKRIYGKSFLHRVFEDRKSPTYTPGKIKDLSLEERIGESFFSSVGNVAKVPAPPASSPSDPEGSFDPAPDPTKSTFEIEEPVQKGDLSTFERHADAGIVHAQKFLGNVHYYGDFGHPRDYALALKWYSRAAEKGDPEAMSKLGVMFAEGLGVQKNQALALGLYRKAAEQGSGEAQGRLGLAYAYGMGVPQDYGTALSWLQKGAARRDPAAEAHLGLMHGEGKGTIQNDAEATRWISLALGHALGWKERVIDIGVPDAETVNWLHLRSQRGLPQAQLLLGAIYAHGLGLPKDDRLAFKWYRAAAEQGVAEAQSALGTMYAVGAGVAQNDAQAVKWIGKAAAQGFAEAQCLIGRMYKEGRHGVPHDDAAAYRWFELAAQQGFSDAQFELGMTHREGRGAPLDHAAACRWFRKAADQGHAAAQHRLGIAYDEALGVAKDDKVATEWFEKAADQGLVESQYRMAVAYSNGYGVEKSDVLAARWYQRAAEQGHPEAQYAVCVHYDHGIGVTRDTQKAFNWCLLAAEQGEPLAQVKLGNFYADGDVVQQNFVEADKWFLLAGQLFPDSYSEYKLDALKSSEQLEMQMTGPQVREARNAVDAWISRFLAANE